MALYMASRAAWLEKFNVTVAPQHGPLRHVSLSHKEWFRGNFNSCKWEQNVKYSI